MAGIIRGHQQAKKNAFQHGIDGIPSTAHFMTSPPLQRPNQIHVNIYTYENDENNNHMFEYTTSTTTAQFFLVVRSRVVYYNYYNVVKQVIT